MKQMIYMAAFAAAACPAAAQATSVEAPLQFKAVARLNLYDENREFDLGVCDLRRTGQSCTLKIRSPRDMPLQYPTLMSDMSLRPWKKAVRYDVVVDAPEPGRFGIAKGAMDSQVPMRPEWTREAGPQDLVEGLVWNLRGYDDEGTIGKLVITFTPVGEEWAAWGRAEEDLTRVAKTSPAATDGAVAASEIAKTEAEAKPWWKFW